jgi:hypothetical protein
MHGGHLRWNAGAHGHLGLKVAGARPYTGDDARGTDAAHSRMCIYISRYDVGGPLVARQADALSVYVYVRGLGRTWQALLS